MKKLYVSVVVLGAAVGVQGAFYQDSAVFGLGLTDFTTSVTLDKFDPNFGNLISVSYTLDATISGEVSVDNETATQAASTLIVSGRVKVRDGAVTWLEVTPSTMEDVLLGPDSDDQPDFTGADARTATATLNASDTETTTDLPTLNWFTATVLGETFSWDIDAVGLSGALGSGIQSPDPAPRSARHRHGSLRIRLSDHSRSQHMSGGLGLIGTVVWVGRRKARL
jgi:hypothetical protein